MPQTREERVRSWHFVLTGALGGLVGFALMEIVQRVMGPGDGTQAGAIWIKAVYFCGFGLAVGAALGMTEGWVRKDRGRLVYGLILGLVLGAVGGGLGGAIGQAIYGLYPHRYVSGEGTNLDLAIVLDSSGSMKELIFRGNDPHGERRDAANQLVDRLGPTDRVTIVDFDETARAWLPLTTLDSSSARRAARKAIGQVDDFGGTNLTAGLQVALHQLASHPEPDRNRHIIFLTDGEGAYDPAVLAPAATQNIRIHTVGLGAAIDPSVLQSIADATGGSYYPVDDAQDLMAIFERIYETQVASMNDALGTTSGDLELTTPWWILFVLRVVSWGAVGALVGFGQGVRENTREDLRACALGGLVGGLLGGALFDLSLLYIPVGTDIFSRFLADVTVGAMIGGSMRLAQTGLVGEETTALSSALPDKGGAIRFFGS